MMIEIAGLPWCLSVESTEVSTGEKAGVFRATPLLTVTGLDLQIGEFQDLP